MSVGRSFLFCFCAFVLFSADSFSQTDSILIKEVGYKKYRKIFAAPVIFTATGLLLSKDYTPVSSFPVREFSNRIYPNFNSRADDYLMMSPLYITSALNLVGVKGKNNFGNRTAITIKALLIQHVIVSSLKHVVNAERPAGGGHSFPSSHTARAFTAASIMSREYGDKSVWYSIGAYSIAATTGTMRILNDAHWLTDVLVGAGIGILSSKLAYATHQYKWNKKKKELTITPALAAKTFQLQIRAVL